MPRERVVYDCKYCGKEYTDAEECVEHEESHIRDYSQASTKEISDELRQLGNIAYGYHIGDTVMGIPISNFESLMREAAKRLEEVYDYELHMKQTGL